MPFPGWQIVWVKGMATAGGVVLGIDGGTESIRAGLFEAATGKPTHMQLMWARQGC